MFHHKHYPSSVCPSVCLAGSFVLQFHLYVFLMFYCVFIAFTLYLFCGVTHGLTCAHLTLLFLYLDIFCCHY